MATKSGIKAGKAFVVIEALDMTGAVLRKISRKFQQFGDRLLGIGSKLIGGGLAALAPAAFSLNTFAKFDDSLRKVEARSTGTAAEMQGLRDQAKELGRTTSFTAVQVGELQGKLAQKGFDRKGIKAMTGDVLALARAAGEGDEGDTTIAADLVSGTLRAFQMDAGQAGRVSDVFAAAVNNSNFSLESLKDGMAKVSPLAKNFNMSLEETVATLASMTNLNISSTEAGTALTSFLARMSNSSFTSGFNKELEKLTGSTVNFRDEAGNLRKPLDLLDEIGKKTKGLGTAQQGDLLSKLFGVRQFGKATGGAAGAVDAFKLLNKLQKDSQGEAKKTAAAMDAGLGGSFRRMMSALEGIQIAIGEALAKPLAKLTPLIETYLTAAGEWIENNQGIVVTVAAVIVGVIALGTVLVALGIAFKILAIAIGAVATVLTILKLGFLVLTSPIGLVIAAIAAVIVILFNFVESFRNAVNAIAGFFQGIGETISRTFKGVFQAISMGDFKAAWEITVAGMSLAWLEFVDKLINIWVAFKKTWLEVWEGAMLSMKKMWFSAQKSIATGILDLAAKQGVLGDVFDMILGTDVSGEVARGKELNRKALQSRIEQQLKIGEKQETLRSKQTELGGLVKNKGELDAAFERGGEAMRKGFSPEDFLKKTGDKAGALALDILQRQREIQQLKEPGKRHDPLADAKAGIEKTFGDKIAKAESDVKSLAEFSKEAEKAGAARRKEIEARKKNLDGLLKEIDARAKAKEAADKEAAPGGLLNAEEALNKLKGLAGAGVGGVGLRRTAIGGLEQGTVEAAKKAIENSMRGDNVPKKQLEEQKKGNDLLEKNNQILGEMLADVGGLV